MQRFAAMTRRDRPVDVAVFFSLRSGKRLVLVLVRNNHSQRILALAWALLLTAMSSTAAILEITPTNQTIIKGQVAQFSAQIIGDATPPFSFTWSGPSSFSSFEPTINATNAGKYTVRASDSAGQIFGAVCATLNVKVPPTVAVSNAVLTCSQPKVTLKAITTAFNATYSWTGPGFLSGETTATPVVNLPGTYSVMVTAKNGCSASATATVTEDKSPPPLSVAPPDILSATNPTVFLHAYSSSNVYFIWLGPGIVSGSRSNICAVNRPGNYSVIAYRPQFGLLPGGTITYPTNPIYTPFDPTNIYPYDPYGTNIESGSLWTNSLVLDPCPDVPRGAIIDENNVTNFVGGGILGVTIQTNGSFNFHYDEELTSSFPYGNGCSVSMSVTVQADSSFVFEPDVRRIGATHIRPITTNGVPTAHQIVITWPTNLSGYTLQSASDLSLANPWTDSTNAAGLEGSEFVVTNSVSSNIRFFRLRK